MFSKIASSLAIAALVATASAETAPGFPIQASQQLTIRYGNNTVSPPGERIPRPETAQPPTINSPVWFSSSSSGPSYGVLLMVDIDVPRNGSRVQLIHWLATNVTLYISPSSGEPTSQLLIDNEAAPAPYLQPSPPVGDVPHAYTWVLFQQPADFSIPAQYQNLSSNRVPFNVSRFVADTGLGNAVAGNYITVQNTTGSATATFPPARPTESASVGAGNGTAEFPGMAARFGGAVWAGVGSAVAAGLAMVVL